MTKSVDTWQQLNELASWGDRKIDFIAHKPGPSPSQASEIGARAVSLLERPGFELVAIQDPTTGNAYVGRGIYSPQSFYVMYKDDVLAFNLFLATLSWRGSYLNLPKSPVEQAIGRFVTEYNRQMLVDDERDLSSCHGFAADCGQFSRVFFDGAAPQNFFRKNSSDSSQPVTPTIKSVSLSGDVLQLSLISPGNVHEGTFWIDLQAKKVVRAVVDNREISTEGVGLVR